MDVVLRTARGLLVFGQGVLLLTLISACGETPAQLQQERESGNDPAAASRRDGDGDAPSLYLDQTVERLEEGRNLLREGYREQLKRCQEAGIATTPISESDEKLIGTQRWQTWRDRDRFAYRIEQWEVDQPPGHGTDAMCSFSLLRTGSHGYIDASRSVTVDFASGERSEDQGDPAVVLEPMAGANDPQDLALARQRGMQGPVPDTVAGLPCDRWQTSQGHAVCVWSGGLAWGIGSIADGEFLAVDGVRPDYIVLHAEPPAGGSGDRLETKAISVDAPLEKNELIPVE